MMSEEVRGLPEQTPRVETGPVRFGEGEWTDLLVRGDDCFYFGMHLRFALSKLEPGPYAETGITHAVLSGLASLLEGTNEGKKMDPDKALAELLNLAEEYWEMARDHSREEFTDIKDNLQGIGRMAWLIIKLDAWLKEGGSLPDAWKQGGNGKG